MHDEQELIKEIKNRDGTKKLMVSQIGEHEKRTRCGICKIICDEFLFTLLIVNFHNYCVFGSVLISN